MPKTTTKPTFVEPTGFRTMLVPVRRGVGSWFVHCTTCDTDLRCFFKNGYWNKSVAKDSIKDYEYDDHECVKQAYEAAWRAMGVPKHTYVEVEVGVPERVLVCVLGDEPITQKRITEAMTSDNGYITVKPDKVHIYTWHEADPRDFA